VIDGFVVEAGDRFVHERVERGLVAPPGDARNGVPVFWHQEADRETAVRVVQRSAEDGVFPGDMPENRAPPEFAGLPVDFEKNASAQHDFDGLAARLDLRRPDRAVRRNEDADASQFRRSIDSLHISRLLR